MDTCRTLSRRTVLQAAAALGLSFVMPALDLKATERRGPERRKSLLVLWMGGGPSQLETWDPHPGTKHAGPGQAIDTTLKDARISSLYPRLAEQIGALNIIRSLSSKEGDHERGTTFVKTGYRPDPILLFPSVSAIAAFKLPSEGLEIPNHVALADNSFPARGGFLGAEWDAFRIPNPGQQITNMRPLVNDDRQQRRLANLNAIGRTFANGRQIQTGQTLHQLTVERALQMMSSEQLKAFETQHESESLREAYGRNRFGQGCLVARRLIEAGVRAVEVTLSGWDSHANNYEGHVTQAGILDPAFATLLDDLKKRDLLDSTIVLCIGEFGRTPTINPVDGRDHWPKWFSCVVGGGGLVSGRVIGETDPDGTADAKSPIEVPDLYATLLKALGIDHTEEFITRIGRPIAFSKGQPLSQLLDA